MATSKKFPDRAAVIEKICARLETGETLRTICRDKAMPDRAQVYRWMKDDEALTERFRIAREIGYDAIAESCIEIADDARNDWMDARAEDGDAKALEFNGEHVQRSKLRVWTRLELLKKWDPARYGERLQHSNDPKNPLPAPQFIVQPTRPAAEVEDA